ncbi:zinc ribbon domain-containing protein [Ureibacillus manganicus]|uniref:DZANK-type domain-containing protein n=1 Tax=Ureibacillus manganicus DSM 26584 TaxID=1384049 RepID=A0A0A3I8C5_9BACL|nr:zinc ribbon domain-containing protein [Ureibacillus manganicus]KGR78993.1 hypothetical protein CD29_08225 [Ureibacillus manganicus DSM 26584]
MEKKKFVTEQHEKTRTTFRVLGPIFLVVGAICMLIAFIDFFSAFNEFEGPKYFWLFFVGMPLLFVGIVLTQAGFAGAIAQYGSREIAPVAKDTFNYLASETASGVKEISKAIHEGTNSTHSITCVKCNAKNSSDSKFCKQCGDKLVQVCHHCEKENSSDARYCNYCGKSLG